ncbi:uncharacterized protein LOC104658004 [Rhinopithecus roxellana]|uniref:uncharacterized protein LOC104658004 n=1 Tax=Rhinopithecus roxellana TaxID=61622 RepID=UPI0005332E1F|nr:uncharacterized protein LOC104658004 [Rhinopithecus roxellana]XP_017714128.1 PREDICTED: uncharacterized protein LOC108519561 [Rhinopithecus bieti]
MGPAAPTSLDGTTTPQGPQGSGLGAPSSARPLFSPGDIFPQRNSPRRGPWVTRDLGLGVEGNYTAQEIAMKSVDLQARAAEGGGAVEKEGLGMDSGPGVVRSPRALNARRQWTDICAEVARTPGRVWTLEISDAAAVQGSYRFSQAGESGAPQGLSALWSRERSAE